MFLTRLKFNIKYLKVLTGLVLLFIAVSQGGWIYNMYTLLQSELLRSMNRSFEIAILKELNDRHVQLGGTIRLAPITFPDDTTRFITKTIRMADTTFQVTFDRQDPYFENKLIQSVIKEDLPVDVFKLDSLFRAELASARYPDLETCVEYIDLKTDRILESSSTPDPDSYLSADLFPIDINDSLGLRAYVKNPAYSILEMMMLQLVLSVILIGISAIFIFYLVRTIFWQKKEERMRQDSISAMTHEFKRPISSAVAQASLIPYYLEKNNGDRVVAYANNVMLELNKLTAYTEKIQQLSKDSRANVILTKTTVELRPFIESVLERYADVKEKPVGIDLKITTLQEYINVDRLHFSNVIDNLIENAIKYSKKEVRIEIRISDNNNRLAISVKDNGFGISAFDLPYIFDKYYRSRDKEAQKSVGFGLGLTYVKAIIEAHGGEVWANSELTVGSEFILYLPPSNYEKQDTFS